MKTVFIPPILDYFFLRQLPQQIADMFHKRGYRVIFCGVQQNSYMKKEIKKDFFIYSSEAFALHDIKQNNIKIDIIYNTWAKNYNYVEILKPDMVIYHSCDSFDDWKGMESDMLKNSDLVFCTSEYLYNIRKKQHNKVFLCRNGCNEEMIERSEFVVFDKLANLKRPAFCFSGAIGQWVSTNMLKNIANKHTLVFAGIEFGRDLPKNIVTVGKLDHDPLIDFYYNCDFGVLPFNTKLEITQAACPIKLYEYLACGLPVLSTEWEETNLESLKEVVFTSNEKEKFLELAEMMTHLSEAEIKDLKSECFKVARENTWDKRFEIIEKEISKEYGYENTLIESCSKSY